MSIWGTRRLQIIDSHTGGEPTRVVVAGWPTLEGATMKERIEYQKKHFDEFRSALVNEPRGNDAMVGAILVPPIDPASATGVIFVNNEGYLGGCIHGTIGVVTTLAYLGRIKPGDHKIETSVGTVTGTLHESGEVTVMNVASYRFATGVEVDVEGHGKVHGDIAWSGNWFFLVNDHGQDLNPANVRHLTDFSSRIREGIERQGIKGGLDKHDGLIDHIELFVPGKGGKSDSKNFVLCPGLAYDRSPCGTGTSAKLACLQADGKLKEGGVWKQESIIGSIFEGGVKLVGDVVYPIVKGSAFVNAEATLVLNDQDPFCWGIRL